MCSKNITQKQQPQLEPPKEEGKKPTAFTANENIISKPEVLVTHI